MMIRIDTLTPNEAFDKGSDYIVMGRPLIHSEKS